MTESAEVAAKTRITKTEISEKILELLHERSVGSTICPSEVARTLDKDDWRELMDAVRDVADELRSKKKIYVTQRGKKISSAVAAKGPIRLKLAR